MTKDQLDALHEQYRYLKQHHSDLRTGQAYMNALSAVRPDVYEKIINTEADCFYQDSRLGVFFLTIYNPLLSIKQIKVEYE